MTTDWLAPVAALALVDGTSLGTLAIPVWLMLAPGLRAGRLLAYLGTVAGAYLLLGLALLVFGTALADPVGGALGSTPGLVVQLAAGLVLLALGLTIEPLTRAGKEQRAEREARRLAEHGPSRLQRWRADVLAGGLPVRTLVLLALAAVAVEAASMVPYLAALGMMGTSGLGTAGLVPVLAGYCVLMVAPALVLLALRVSLHQRLGPVLQRLAGWLERGSRETLAWVLFLLGAYLAVSAAGDLGWLD